jgi:hypothetical protein
METLKHLLGLMDEGKRIYQIHEESEMDAEEFAYCKTMYNVVFGPNGICDTLGPTWEMIHDPRFTKIENSFIVKRRAFFGGDARQGKQYVSTDGFSTSTIEDLEQYSEILGEGRHYHNCLVHPNASCPTRLWLERVFSGYTDYNPGELYCTCSGVRRDPRTWKNASDEEIWELIRQESPNRAFDKDGVATNYGKLLFTLMREDVVGLIADYAETARADSYTFLDTGDPVGDAAAIRENDPNGADRPRILQEVDLLEQALSYRATLRVGAVKLIKSIKLDTTLKGRVTELTDAERDQVLSIVYRANWPEDKIKVMSEVLYYVVDCTSRPLEERLKEQLAVGAKKAQDMVAGLKDGSIQPINQDTDPTAEVELDEHAKIVEEIMRDPLKTELFMLYVDAEKRGNTAVAELLSPVFSSAEYDLTVEHYFELLNAIQTGSKSLPADLGNRVLGVSQTSFSSLTHYQEISPEDEAISKVIAEFKAHAKEHDTGCELREHFTSHIDKSGNEFDCEHMCTCGQTQDI